MSTTSSIRQQWLQWPLPVRRFFLRALLMVVVWKILYLFILMPSGQPNRWLTNHTAASTAWLVNTLGEHPKAYPHYEANRAHVYNERQQNLLIGNSCNGLELYVLYAGFLICLPVTVRTRWLLFLLGGLVLMYVLNILRCAGLYWLMVRHSHWQDFAHKFLFKAILYAIIAGLWYAYTRPKHALEAD